jgi:4Fe-4S ferredoxin
MVKLFEIYTLLPKENCGECGFDSCMAFALSFIKSETDVKRCKHLSKEDQDRLLRFKELFEKREKSGLILAPEKCTGCGNCVISCPINAENARIAGGKGVSIPNLVFKVVNGKLEIVNIELCRRVSKGSGRTCRICVEACPSGAIEFA